MTAISATFFPPHFGEHILSVSLRSNIFQVVANECACCLTQHNTISTFRLQLHSFSVHPIPIKSPFPPQADPPLHSSVHLCIGARGNLPLSRSSTMFYTSILCTGMSLALLSVAAPVHDNGLSIPFHKRNFLTTPDGVLNYPEAILHKVWISK